jgi:hypothetical protein
MQRLWPSCGSGAPVAVLGGDGVPLRVVAEGGEGARVQGVAVVVRKELTRPVDQTGRRLHGPSCSSLASWTIEGKTTGWTRLKLEVGFKTMLKRKRYHNFVSYFFRQINTD